MQLRRFTIVLPLLLLVSCGGGSQSDFEEFTFTAEDAAEISALLDQIESEQGGEGATTTLDVTEDEVTLNVADAHKFDALRTNLDTGGENVYGVTNVFLNVRSEPNVRSVLVDELKEGDRVKVIEFPNAEWAHIELMDGRKGFVSTKYIARVVSDQELPDIQKQYEGKYQVNFRFLNVRAEPNAQSQKLGELSANQIIEPIAVEGDWARVPFEGGEGYVSAQYLKPFMPKLIVRQDHFNLPILRYRADDEKVADALISHLAFLKSQGKRILTLRDFYAFLLDQEDTQAKLPADALVLVITDVTKITLKEVADALHASDVQATIFLQTDQIGTEGISPEEVQRLVANGNDVESASHTGEDLRAMTNTQVQREMAQSRQVLEDITGKDVIAIAYPAGGVNDRIAEQAMTTGYLFGLTLTPAVGEGIERSQFLRLPSNLITPGTSEQTLGTVVGGNATVPAG